MFACDLTESAMSFGSEGKKVMPVMRSTSLMVLT